MKRIRGYKGMLRQTRQGVGSAVVCMMRVIIDGVMVDKRLRIQTSVCNLMDLQAYSH